MKTLPILLSAFAVLTAGAQPAPTGQSLHSIGAQPGKAAPALSLAIKPNEILKRKVTYSGIAVQAIKTSHPLQLVNPAAPAKYGSAEDNTLRDPMNGRAFGLKLLSLRF